MQMVNQAPNWTFDYKLLDWNITVIQVHNHFPFRFYEAFPNTNLSEQHVE
jgi:hypothetical protein